MFGKRKSRPWKKHAFIERVERNDGDVEYITYCRTQANTGRFADKPYTELYRGKEVYKRGAFQSLDAAEADLDAWWAEWWPEQTKSSRRA